MKKKKIVIIFLVAILASVYFEKLDATSMEGLNIAAGFGYDIEKGLNGNIQYSIPFSIYDFKNRGKTGIGTGGEKTGEQSSNLIKIKANTIGETRQERQLKITKPLVVGTERVGIISEEQAKVGIGNLVNILFSNAKINDRDSFVVCKGRAEDILGLKIKGYASSSDYIEGMIKSSLNYNFLSDKYILINMYIMLDSEGVNLVLPYIELNNGEIINTGMAIFKGDKMVNILSMEDAKIMNILREKNVKGILNIQESPEKYISYDAIVNKKVTCNKKNGKYEFDIQLSFNGDIIQNTLYKDIHKGNEREFQKLMEKKIENMCIAFTEKIKNTYKVDLLNLGMYAAAKYGRESGVDWNEQVSNSDINIKVKVKIDKTGNGQY